MTGAWPMVSLGEICEIQRGGSPRPISSYITESEEGINWIKIGDVAVGAKYLSSTEEKIKPEGAKRSRMVYPGDFILSNSMSFGRPYIMRTSGCIHDGWLVLRDTNKRLSEDYLYRVLGSDFVVSQFKKMAVGAVVKNLNKEVVQAVVIPLPPLPEQRRIAAILDQADALRAKRREALAQLDSLTQSIFIEMFGDPVTNAKGWETRSLLDSCDQINDCPHSTPTWTEFGEIGLRTSNLTAGGWNWDDTRYVSSETYHERSKRGYVTTGDIVLSREGTIGIAAIVTSEMKVCMGQRLVQVRPTRSLLSSEFLLRHLLFVLSPKRIGQLMVGSTSQHLNVKELKLLKIPLPPLSIQLEFSRISAALAYLKMAEGDSLTELNTLFASLQHRAFRGEL